MKWGKKEKDDSIRYFISYTDIYIENANMVGGSHSYYSRRVPTKNRLEQLKKKWEDLSSATKAKYAKRRKTGVQVQ